MPDESSDDLPANPWLLNGDLTGQNLITAVMVEANQA